MRKKIIYLFNIMMMNLFVFSAYAQDNGVERVGTQTAKGITMVGAIVLGIAFLIGLIYFVNGLLRIKANKDSRGQKEGGPMLIGVGICLMSVSFIVAALTGYFTGEEVDVNTVTEQVYGD